MALAVLELDLLDQVGLELTDGLALLLEGWDEKALAATTYLTFFFKARISLHTCCEAEAGLELIFSASISYAGFIAAPLCPVMMRTICSFHFSRSSQSRICLPEECF